MLTYSEAREIAATWQSPGREGIGFAQFASTGTVTDALLEDIDRELATDTLTGEFRAELTALRAYVDTLDVRVYSVGSNTAGYLPEADVFYSLAYSDALDAYVDSVREAPSGFFPDAMSGDEEEYESMSAHVKAYLTDEIDTLPHGYREPIAFALRPDHLPLPHIYWLACNTTTVKEYREALSLQA